MLERDPAILAGAVAGAGGTWIGASATAGSRAAPGWLVLTGALMGAVVGTAARRWTWSSARVEEELLDAEIILETAGAAGEDGGRPR